MPKLAKTFAEIDEAISIVVDSQVSQANLENLAGITASYSDINGVITAFKDTVYLNETHADEYDHANAKLYPPDNGLINFTISSYSLSGELIVVPVPKKFTTKMSVYSCSTSKIILKIDDFESEALSQGLQLQLIICYKVA